jgi:hypothetical protein
VRPTLAGGGVGAVHAEDVEALPVAARFALELVPRLHRHPLGLLEVLEQDVRDGVTAQV